MVGGMIYPSNEQCAAWISALMDVIPVRKRGHKAVKVDLIDLRDATGLPDETIYDLLGPLEMVGSIRIDDFGGIWQPASCSVN